MLSYLRWPLLSVIAAISIGALAQKPSQQQQLSFVPPTLLSSLHWRSIGPYRGGRTRAVAGVPSQPNVVYIGVCNGGVWKTTDYGATWQPIFDDQPTGSIGAIAVAQSDPNVVYVGSGEGLHRPDLSVGDGIYKSTDAGKTWTHLGLRDGQQIPQLAVDPRDPNKVFAAVAGHPYGPNKERGVYRSTDGGQTFQKVLPVIQPAANGAQTGSASSEKQPASTGADATPSASGVSSSDEENIGASDVLIDPSNPETVYATLWEAREGPWENGAWNGPGGGVFKSTDGGKTFQQLAGGLPKEIIQAHIAIAESNPRRLIASVASNPRGADGSRTNAVALYRSDDAGATWAQITTDARPAGRIGGGDLSVPRFNPKDQDMVIVTSTVTWKSTDGGKTWTGFRGAPGGDDYQNLWINPNNPQIIAIVSDQGAIITVNGGETWSSWYNQPTAQMYHVNADNAFPYRVCSGQQESGSACISSRGNDGEITIREWHPVTAEEYGYVVPDPLDPDIVYGGKLTRYDRRTDQAQNVSPKAFRSPDFRMLRTEPIVFSPVDPHILYFAANTLWKTTNAGQSWQQISPDLTRATFEVPASVGKYRNEESAKPTPRGVIYAVAPSPLDVNRIWAGTDDGRIHLTTDGGAHWTEITPSGMTAFQKVSIIDASHFDAQTAYAAINTLRLDDLRPHILRTRDSGKSWTEIVNGIPGNENVNAVREDPIRRGLLFASTERQVYVSFDDGDHWQSLRLNMAPSSVRDIIIKGDDLVAATHGRGFWILDDITPLRQFQPKVISADAFLFKPQTAIRVRWDMNPDTPLPPDFPAGENPPDGAVIDYYLHSDSSAPVTLEIKDSAGKTVRKYSSADKPDPIDPMLAIPTYWVRPPQTLSAAAGTHRFLWDMHYPQVPGVEPEYPIAAIPHNTAPQATGPWVMPGQFTVVLTANGKSYSQPLTIKMDPRVKTPAPGLQQQFKLSTDLYTQLLQLSPAVEQASGLRKQLKEMQAHAAGESLAAIKAFDQKLQALAGGAARRPGAGTEPPSLGGLRTRFLALLGALQEADVTPTSQAVAAVAELQKQLPPLLERWNAIKSQDLPALNKLLKDANQPELKLETTLPGATAAVSSRDED
ncbi:MAG TPA: glycoside hydrolase [Candidatus Angelobacter sp.]|nr:glycoside hydrolase [Candidatus Angelobacter sp.]